MSTVRHPIGRRKAAPLRQATTITADDISTVEKTLFDPMLGQSTGITPPFSLSTGGNTAANALFASHLSPLRRSLVAVGLFVGIASPATAQVVCSPVPGTACGAKGGAGGPDRASAGGEGNGQGGGAQDISQGRIPVDGLPAIDGKGGDGATGIGVDGSSGGAGGGGGDLGTLIGNAMTGGRGTDGFPHIHIPGGGGGGGAGMFVTAPLASTTDGFAYTGGAGGNGGTPGNGSGGSGGGGGGTGLILGGGGSQHLTVTNGSSITGGNGGNGGEFPGGATTWGGGGGGGGDGVLVLGANAAVSIDAGGIVEGGAGGAGGYGGFVEGEDGDSGAGIRAMGIGLNVDNHGAIRGANGTGDGAAGVGIITQGTANITNYGTLSGGMDTKGRASSVLFNGTSNTLNLQSGSTVIGVVEVGTGASATIAPSGTTTIDGAKLDGSGAQLMIDLTSASLDMGSGITGTGDISGSGAGILTLHGVNLTGSLDLGNSGGVVTSGGVISTSGLQRYAGPVQVGADTTFSSIGGSIAFDQSINGTHALEVDASTRNVYFGNTLGGVQALSSVAVNSNTLSIGGVNAGLLDLDVSTGITQSGVFSITGASVFQTNGDLTLTNVGNTFGGALQIQAANVAVAASGALNVSSLSVAPGGDITLTSGDVLTLPTGGLSTLGTITLKGTFASGNLSAQSIDLDGTGALILDGAVTATNGLALHATGNVSQTAGAITTNTISVDAGSNDVLLNQAGNAINTVGDVSARDLSIANSTALTFAGIVHVDTLDLNVASASITGSITADAVANLPSGTTLTVGNGGAVGTLQADVVDHGTLVFDRSDSVSFAGALGGNGTLVQRGSGDLVFDGDGSAFQGQTRIEAGDLVVGSTAGSSARLAGDITVADGATLGGHGSVGNTTVLAGGTLAPGASIGTLTVDGNLVMAQETALDFEFGVPGLSDSVSVGGNLSLNGVKLDVTNTGTMGPGVYRIFDYSGTLTETNGGLSFGSIPAGSHFQLQTLLGNKQINLLNVGATTLNFWNANGLASGSQRGGGDGTWSTTSSTWTDENGSITGAMSPQPGFAIFGGETGTVTVNDVGGASPVETTGMQFAADGYHLEGDRLTLLADASRPAPVEIRVGDGGAGSEDWTATIDNVITGTDGLRKTGAGVLVLTGANSFTGDTAIDAGTLAVSSDANLGDVSGALSFDGGTLKVTGTGFTTTGRSITLGNNGGGFDIADAGNTFTLSQDISGAGLLAKSGDGTLVLTGTNRYTGGTLVQGGTLVGDATSIRGELGNAGRVVFDQASDATFDDDIAGLSGTNGTMFKKGAGKLTLAGSSMLDWTVDAGVLVSSAERFAGDVEIGSAGSFTFDQSVNGIYTGLLSGTGSFDKTGAGVLAYDGNGSGLTGTTTVEEGSLIVGSDAGHEDAVLGGPVDVLSGALLGGHGTVGTVTLEDRATIAPGNSIGTLNVAGDITFNAGSIYEVEVDPAGIDSDLIHATGTATLNGASVAHIGADGSYKRASTYTILTADGGLAGTFGTVTSDFAFLEPSLSYDADSVYLKLTRNHTAFCLAGMATNQCATGNGAESTGSGSPIYDAIIGLSADQATSAFDQLSGEAHASLKGVLIDDSHFVRDVATDRIRAAFGAVGADTTPVLAYGEDGNVLAPADTLAPAAWGRAFGAWTDLDGDGNTASLSSSTGGFLTGIDAALSQNWRLGILAGYSHTTFDIDDRYSSGSSQNWHLGLYGGGQWEVAGGTLGLRGGAAYTWHDIETARSVAFPGFSNSLKGDYGAGTAQVFGEIAYDIKTGSIGLEPFANLAYVNLNTDAFTEKSGAAALSSASTDTDVTFASLGLRASTGFTIGNVEATARGMLGWRHAYGDTTPLSTFAFAGSDPFSIAGIPIAKDAALIEAGLDLTITPDATIGLSYQGQLASGAKQNGFNATLNVKF